MNKLTETDRLAIFERCAQNICENLEHSAVKVSRPVKDCGHWDVYTIFVDIYTGSLASFDKIDISAYKDYRQLRNLIKTRIIAALHDMRNLVEESLIKLGDRECLHSPDPNQQPDKGDEK